MNKKLKVIQTLTVSDFFIAIYSYLTLVNFDEFKKILVQLNSDTSIEFAMSIYQIFLQTIIFTGLVFIIFHLIIYFFYFKEKKFAQMYVKFYAIVAALSLILGVLFSKQFILLIPLILYVIAIKQMTTKTVE